MQRMNLELDTITYRKNMQLYFWVLYDRQTGWQLDKILALRTGTFENFVILIVGIFLEFIMKVATVVYSVSYQCILVHFLWVKYIRIIIMKHVMEVCT